MDICDVIYKALVVIMGAGEIFLVYILINTFWGGKPISDYLVVTNWFNKYYEINQKRGILRKPPPQLKKLLESKDSKPIREVISECGKLFEEDMQRAFEKLEPNKTYRLTTHYAKIILKAQADEKIQLLREPSFQKKRTLREVRGFIGKTDYRLLKKCFKHNPQIERCCAKYSNSQMCKCSKGNVCTRGLIKRFFKYEFVKL